MLFVQLQIKGIALTVIMKLSKHVFLVACVLNTISFMVFISVEDCTIIFSLLHTSSHA